MNVPLSLYTRREWSRVELSISHVRTFIQNEYLFISTFLSIIWKTIEFTSQFSNFYYFSQFCGLSRICLVSMVKLRWALLWHPIAGKLRTCRDGKFKRKSFVMRLEPQSGWEMRWIRGWLQNEISFCLNFDWKRNRENFVMNERKSLIRNRIKAPFHSTF